MTSGKMTYHQMIDDLKNDPEWAWTATWWNTTEIIVQFPRYVWNGYVGDWNLSAEKFDSFEVKNPTYYIPPTITALGCSGRAGDFDLWVGWDLDVGHGRTSYSTTLDALTAANQIKTYLGGAAEIRLSKSGKGVHVRHKFKMPRPAGDAARIALRIATKLSIQADPTVLGRQCMWLWIAAPNPSSFQLVS